MASFQSVFKFALHIFSETLIWALTVHRLDGFYHNFFYTCPNDEIFYRLKVKTLLNIFLVLSFCKFGRLEAQKAPTPLGGRWTGSNASHPTGVGSNATPPTGVGQNASQSFLTVKSLVLTCFGPARPVWVVHASQGPACMFLTIISLIRVQISGLWPLCP